MKLFNPVPLSEIREQREHEASLPLSIGALGQELVQEKLKNTQNQQMISFLGQELAKTKLEIASLKGGNA